MTARAGRVLALSGGVGGARLAAGLAAVLPSAQSAAAAGAGVAAALVRSPKRDLFR